MRTRHRIPTIFNLSMVDVLCCALGCVILLWLVNLRAAKESADQAGQTDQKLVETENELATARADLADRDKDIQALKAQRDESTAQAAARLQAAQAVRDQIQAQLDKTNKEITALKADKAATEQRLVRKADEARDLDKKLSASAQRVATLEGQLREKETLASDSARRLKELAERLSDADGMNKQLREEVKSYRDKFQAEEALAKALEKDLAGRKRELADADKELQNFQAMKRAFERDLENRDKELAAARPFRDKFAAAEARLQALEKEAGERRKELAAANRSIDQLLDDKKALVGEVSRARAAADNRFAGIALTGKRVVFLVDMSGSMELVDERTAAPDKWAGVRETLARIMKSLPDLEKFQVILFAEKATYLLGNEDRWLDFDPKTSVEQTTKALAAVKPRGGTNMYAALEAAFRFQKSGLDTVYLLSDGLPNIGEGLAAETARTLKETEKAEILSKHIRKTLLTDWNRAGAGRIRVRINAVGFFYESPDVGAFLWALARENDGSFVGMSKP